MTFRPATDDDQARWQALLGRVPSGDFLHDWAWADVAAFDGQPQRRFVVEEGGELVALAAAQVRPIGLGRTFWYVPHGPVTDYAALSAGERVRTIVTGLAGEARADRAVALRLEPRIETGGPEPALLDAVAHRVAERLQVGQTRIVDLDGEDELLAGFDADTRYGVRRATREGVDTRVVTDADDREAIERLHGLVRETQRRAGFRLPPLERYWTAWQALASAGRACLIEARREDELLATGQLVVEGEQSFYLFAGSRREQPGETKRYASYAVQWAMMVEARARGARRHDLWGIAPANAGPDHPWHGVGLFKRGFGGREVTWAGSWEIVIDPLAYRLRSAAARLRRKTRSDVP
ncbi:MAG TPA: peptidoglycan bridge formation glycyltransferase FemA/FemB family protein [Candidatus Limnocylindria bacterium]|nr:peptidoglycan bridge formation glycyltransferase FemA/FemB family protein [Candidatus Limnocylindria bacterium]